MEYAILFRFCQSRADAQLRMTQGNSMPTDEADIASGDETLRRWGLIAREFGFEEPIAFDIKVPAGTIWGHA
jgi:hypothetical protein